MIANVKISLNQNVNIGFFQAGVARLTNARTNQTVGSEVYQCDYISSIGSIDHKTDIKQGGNIEAPVEFVFTILDNGTIKGMVGSNYQLSGARVDVFFQSEQHTYFIDRLELDERSVKVICVNQAYLSKSGLILANSRIKVSPSPESFKAVFTSIKNSVVNTPAVIDTISDNRCTAGNYYGVKLLQAPSSSDNYILLRSKYNPVQSNYIGKDVRVVLTNKDNVIGGVLSDVYLDVSDTSFCFLKVTGIGTQIRFDANTKPEIDTLTAAKLETNIAVYTLPIGTALPVVISVGGVDIYIAEGDSRYDADTNTISIPVQYTEDTYRYLDPVIDVSSNLTFASGYRARYFPDFYSYDQYATTDPLDHNLKWTNMYPDYEDLPIDTAKVKQYIADPDKGVMIYYTGPYSGSFPKFTFRLNVTEDIKVAIASGEKWGVGFNTKMGRFLGYTGVTNDGGYYWMRAKPVSATIGTFVEGANGDVVENYLSQYELGVAMSERYSRDLDDTIPRLPYNDLPATAPFRVETDTLWLDISPEELYLVDYIDVEILLNRFIDGSGKLPWILIDWIGLVVKEKTIVSVADGEVIISNSRKSDLVQDVYGVHGVTVNGSGELISYAAQDAKETTVLKDYTKSTVELVKDVGGAIYRTPLDVYNTTATSLTNLIEGSISELTDVELIDYCNHPTITWTNSKTMEDEQIIIDTSMEVFDSASSVKYSNPDKLEVTALANQLWDLCKNAQIRYNLVAPQDITIYGGTLDEALSIAVDMMQYSVIRRKTINLSVAYQPLTLGQRVKVSHPKISLDYELYGTIEAISLNPEDGVIRLSLACDLLKGADTLFF